MTDLLKLDKVSKFYYSKDSIAIGLRNVSVTLNIGEFVAIVGESGSGKSTFLNVLSGMDSYEEGEFYINGQETSGYIQSDWENFRNENVSFIFQDYNIIDSFTVLQNVETSLMQRYPDAKERRTRALELLEKVGLSAFVHKKGSKLSGGQKQRVVIARALAKESPIIMADEPTGNLDAESGKAIIELLYEISKDKLVIIVTHNYTEIQPYTTRRLRFYDSEIVENVKIKHADKKDNAVESSETHKNRITFKNLIRFSFINVFATPKRFNFLLGMFLISITLITYACGFLFSDVNFKGNTYSPLFKNYSPERIVVSTDGESFTAEQIKLLERWSIRNVEYNDLAMDCPWQTTIGTELISFYPDVIDNYDNLAMVGKMPTAEDEVFVVINGKQEDTIAQAYHSGTKINLHMETYLEKDGYNYEVKISGYYVYNSLTEKQKPVKLYVSQSMYDEMYKCAFFATKTFSFRLPATYKDILGKYHPTTSVAKAYIKEMEFTDKIPLYLLTTTYKNLESEFDSTFTYYDSAKPFIIEGAVDYRGEYEHVTPRGEEDSYVIGIDKETLHDLMYGKRQASIYVPTIFQSMAKNSLVNKGLTISSTEFVKSADSTLILTNVLYLIAFTAIILIMFALIYRICKVMVTSKKKDYNVLRSLGYTENHIKSIIVSELGIVATIAYFIIIIVARLLIYLQSPVVRVLYEMTVGRYIVVFAIIILMVVLLSIKYTNDLFKTSIKKQLNKKD